RMKSIAYVATVVNAYRMALDDYARRRALDMEYILPPILSGELGRASHRPYTTGFALGGVAANIQATASADYVTDAAIGAVVLAYDASKHMAHIEQRNKFLDGDVLSILSPGDLGRSFSVSGIWNEDYEPVKSTPHPRERLMIGCAEPLLPGDILRIIPEKKT
ncbi:MAG: U32 family peptidase, partial [Clostridia bacterium]|nr:U32 family peptidase [Clostridia bacterium]